MPYVLKQLRITAVDFVDAGANPGARITLMKRDDRMSNTQELPAELAERLQALEAQKLTDEDRGLLKRVRDWFAKPEPEPDPATAELAKRDARIADLEARIEKAAEARERDTYLAKAQAVSLFGRADDLGAVLHKIAKALTADEFTAFYGRMTALQKQVEESDLLKVLGVDGGDEATAEDKLERLARERVAKGGETYEQAYDAVLRSDEGKALYAQLRGGN